MIFFQQQSKKKSSFSKKSLFLKAISDKLFEDLKSKETLSLNIFWHKNDSNFWKSMEKIFGEEFCYSENAYTIIYKKKIQITE